MGKRAVNYRDVITLGSFIGIEILNFWVPKGGASVLDVGKGGFTETEVR